MHSLAQEDTVLLLGLINLFLSNACFLIASFAAASALVLARM